MASPRRSTGGGGLTTAEFFSELDNEFHGIASLEDDRFTYQAREVLVQSTWELPIIIQWPGSTIQFSFTTAQGGVEFGIVFVPATDEQQQAEDLQVETIEEMTRVRSDLAPVSGTFQPPCEGVVFFLWDNAYDWSAVKRLSYVVQVHQPSFSLPDADRSGASHNLLLDLLNDQDTAMTRRLDAEDQLAYYTPQVEELTTQWETLRAELASKMAELSLLEAHEDVLVPAINTAYRAVPGLGIRCLNKHLMGVVLGYLPPRGGVAAVCRYWRRLAAEIRVNGPPSGAVEAYHARPEHPRYVKRQASRDVSDEMLQAALAKARAAERARWERAGILTPPEGSRSGHAQWRLSYQRSVSMHPGREEYHRRHAATTAAGEGAGAGRGGVDMVVPAAVIPASPGAAAAVAAAAARGQGHMRATPPSQSGSPAASPSAVVTAAAAAVAPEAAALAAAPAAAPAAAARASGEQRPPPPPPAPTGARPPPPPPKPLPRFEPAPVTTTTITSASEATGGPPPPPPPRPLPRFEPAPPGAPSPSQSVAAPSSSAAAAPATTTASAATATAPVEAPSEPPPTQPAPTSAPAAPITTPAASSSSSSPARAAKPSVITSGITEPTPTANTAISSVTTGVGAPALSSNSSTNTAATAPAMTVSSSSSSSTGGGGEGGSGGREPFLVHVKQIRSEQQLANVIEYIQDGYIAIEQADSDKRKTKKAIKAWNAAFEESHGRPASNAERKAMARDLYDRYQAAAATLRVRCDKVNAVLETVGLTHAGFLKLREKYVEWVEQSQHGSSVDTSSS